MPEIIFKGGVIQKGHRIKIPKPIIDTINLKEGAKVLVIFNANNKTITIKRER